MLSIKKEEQPLGFRAALQLRMHLMFCRFCKAFDKQSRWMSEVLKNLRTEDQLSTEEKTMLKQKISDRLNPKK